MNIYDLSRKFWDFAFENPDKIKPNHGAMYFFAIEHCNRLGWKEKFGFPTVMAMEAIGIKSYNTFINTLKDLVEYGFIEMIEKSKNQYSANIIALSNFDEAHNKALDKALMKHTTKQSESIEQSIIESIDSIDIPIYNITNIPINNITEENIIKENSEELFTIPPNPKEEKKVPQKKRKIFTKVDFKNKLIELGADEEDAEKWMEVRKQKRAVFTEDSIDLILKECEKNNFEFSEAIKACRVYGWQGFAYEWYLNKQNKNNGQTNNFNTNNRTNSPSGNSSRSSKISGKVSARTFLARKIKDQSSGNSESGNITIDAEIIK